MIEYLSITIALFNLIISMFVLPLSILAVVVANEKLRKNPIFDKLFGPLFNEIKSDFIQ